MTTTVTKQQQDDMLAALYQAYLSQQKAGAEVAAFLQPNMDAVQKQIRGLPISGQPVEPPIDPPVPADLTIIDATWGTIARLQTSAFAAFACNPFAVRFSVPADAANDGKPRYISIAASNGPTILRQMVLSETPGKFEGGIAAQQGTQTTIDLGVGGGGAKGLVPGRTYFMNFRNWSTDSGACTCNQSNCNASVDVVW